MASSKKFVFTDLDIDGSMSYLLFLWFNSGKRIPYITVNVSNFKKSFESWLRVSNPDRFDSIYILDIDTSQESLDLVDRSNVVVIDHHDTHVNNKQSNNLNHSKVYKSEPMLLQLFSMLYMGFHNNVHSDQFLYALYRQCYH